MLPGREERGAEAHVGGESGRRIWARDIEVGGDTSLKELSVSYFPLSKC